MVLELNSGLVGFDEAHHILNDNAEFIKQIKALDFKTDDKNHAICFDVKQHKFVKVEIKSSKDEWYPVCEYTGAKIITAINNANAILAIDPKYVFWSIEGFWPEKDSSLLIESNILRLRDAFLELESDISYKILKNKLDYFAAFNAGQISQYNINAKIFHDVIHYSEHDFVNLKDIEPSLIKGFIDLEVQKNDYDIHVFPAPYELISSYTDYDDDYSYCDGAHCIEYAWNFKVPIQRLIDAYTKFKPEDLPINVIERMPRTYDSCYHMFSRCGSLSFNPYTEDQIKQFQNYFLQFKYVNPEYIMQTNDSINKYLETS